jgi:hypothetical protein
MKECLYSMSTSPVLARPSVSDRPSAATHEGQLAGGSITRCYTKAIWRVTERTNNCHGKRVFGAIGSSE